MRPGIAERMTYTTSFFRTICFLAAFLAPSWGVAQDEQPADSLGESNAVFQKKKEDVERMKRILGALNEVDSVYKPQYPAWIVLDLDMKERIRRAFRMRGFEVTPDEDVVVITNPKNREILEISIGSSRMGRIDSYTYLSDSLQAEILDGNYSRKSVDLRPKAENFGTVYGVIPRFAAAYASAFGAGALFSNGWGVEGRMGSEEIGYHFWSTGSLRALAVLDQLKIGVLVPFANGGEDLKRNMPLSIKSRKLTGTFGFTSDFVVPLDRQSINAHLSVGDAPHVSDFDFLTDSTEFYLLHTVAQLTYSRTLELGKGSQITLTGGMGYHQISHGTVMPDLSTLTTDKEDFVSPVIRVEYLNRISNMYGITGQIYSSIVYLKGWVELFPNLLYLEVQYYSPVFRDPRPWEQPYFFMISPRIQVIY